MIAYFKEQVAEISLGNGPAVSTHDILYVEEDRIPPRPPIQYHVKLTNGRSRSQFKIKLAETIAGFPRKLMYRAEEVTDPKLEASLVFTKLVIRLDCLQVEFFFDRLLLKKGYDAGGGLLATSFEIVVMTLGLWTHMDRFARKWIDFQWLVSPNGLCSPSWLSRIV
jgi:hypothetical protein